MPTSAYLLALLSFDKMLPTCHSYEYFVSTSAYFLALFSFDKMLPTCHSYDYFLPTFAYLLALLSFEKCCLLVTVMITSCPPLHIY